MCEKCQLFIVHNTFIVEPDDSNFLANNKGIDETEFIDSKNNLCRLYVTMGSATIYKLEDGSWRTMWRRPLGDLKKGDNYSLVFSGNQIRVTNDVKQLYTFGPADDVNATRVVLENDCTLAIKNVNEDVWRSGKISDI